MPLSVRLRDRRAGLSLATAAAELSALDEPGAQPVAPSMLARWESGGLPRSHLGALARWLGEDPATLEAAVTAEKRRREAEGHRDLAAEQSTKIDQLVAAVAALAAEVAELKRRMPEPGVDNGGHAPHLGA